MALGILKLISVLERIADALDRAYPKREPLRDEKGQIYPPLGITHSDNEILVEREQEEAAKMLSKQEQIMKEVREFNEWKRMGK